MARLIDADKLREKALRGNIPLATSSEMMVRLVDIDAAPTVDAGTVRRGRWRDPRYEDATWDDDTSVCSACGERFNRTDNDVYRFKFCPRCGARMDGEGGGEG